MSEQPSLERARSNEHPEKTTKQSRLKKFAATLAAAGTLFAVTNYGVELRRKVTSMSDEAFMSAVGKEEARPLDTVERESLESRLAYLRAEFSPAIVWQLEFAAETAARHREQAPAEPAVRGWEQLGLKNEDLAKLWSDRYFPRRTIEHNVSSISYVDRPLTTEQYGYKETVSAETEDYSSAITFMRRTRAGDEPRENFLLKLDVIFSHELGHANDCFNAPDLTREQRVEFLYDVTKAYSRKEHFNGADYDLHNIKRSDPHERRLYQVREYWAELSLMYLTFDHAREDLTPEEYSIAEKWLKRNDPAFNPDHALKERRLEEARIAKRSPGA